MPPGLRVDVVNRDELKVPSAHSTESTVCPHKLPRKLPHKVKNRAECAVHAPKVSVSLLSTLFKSLSALRCCSILPTECRTVVWCLPPNWRPISGREASVRCLARYMAIWRGNTMTRELFLDLISVGRSPNCSDTALWIDSMEN